MATTTNYAWTTPDNSGLVKNGAQDIRTLGSAVDTALWNSGYGQAGKNKIINGDFGIWQRGTSFTANGYTADRWRAEADTTFTASRQTFTSGTAPVAGYEGEFFYRMAKNAGGTYGSISQRIEDVRTFANQTITVSFWAKADSATTIVRGGAQNFGSGGSAQVNFATQSQAITTSWARYSLSFAVPSISGKTVGTSSHFILDLYFLESGAKTVDLWGVQVEYGSTATPFQTATGTIQGELAACQRYYYRFTPTATSRIGVGYSDSTTFANINVVFPVQMRIAPTALEQSGTATDYSVANNAVTVCNAVPAIGSSNVQSINLSLQVAAGLVVGQAIQARLVGTAGYLGWSAEL